MLGAVAAVAQPGPDGAPPRWGREQIETVIIGKFATDLDLSPEQAEKFFPRFRQFQNQTEGLQREQGERRRILHELSDAPQADPRQVEDLLAQQARSEQMLAESKRQFLADVSRFLTPQQVSRCSILMDELPRRLQKYIEESRPQRPEEDRMKHSPPSDRQRRRGY